MNLIINGPGRSGTTLLSKLLSYHNEFGWISGYVNQYPNLPILSVLNFVYRLDISGITFYNLNKFPKPAEAYNFWKYHLNKFNDDHIPSKKESEALKRTINQILKYQNKKNFITKITGAARVSIFNEIFSDYEILWIERDPRVVVSSYIKQKWFFKNKTEEFNKLTTEKKIRFYVNYYLQIYSKAKSLNRHVIFYEDLCQNPVVSIEKLLANYNLVFSKSHQRFVSNFPIEAVDWNQYRELYSEKEVILLNSLLEQPLRENKYI